MGDGERYFGSVGGGAATGAASGALIGSAVPVPGVGTAIGAGAGALIGGTLGYFNARGASQQQQAMDRAKKRLEELQRRAWQQRQWDQARQMSFFAPVQQSAQRLTGYAPVDPGPQRFFGGGSG